MLQSLVNYLVPAALGWLAKTIHGWISDYLAKKKAEASAQAKANDAIQAASDHDDTSGLFGGKPL